jgi:internalin A
MSRFSLLPCDIQERIAAELSSREFMRLLHTSKSALSTLRGTVTRPEYCSTLSIGAVCAIAERSPNVRVRVSIEALRDIERDKLRRLNALDIVNLRGRYAPYVLAALTPATLKSIETLELESQPNMTLALPVYGLDLLRELRILKFEELAALSCGAKLCGHLKSLTFASCPMLSDFRPLGACTALEKLTLIDMNLKTARGLNEVENLHTVVLTVSKMRSLVCLSGCKSLRTLTVEMCFWLDDLHGLESATNLQSLNLSMNTRLADVSALKDSKSLTALEIKSCRFIWNHDAMGIIGTCGALRSLRLLQTLIPGDSLAGLETLTNLEDFFIHMAKNHFDALSPTEGSTMDPREHGHPVTDLTPIVGIATLKSLNLKGGVYSATPGTICCIALKTLELVKIGFSGDEGLFAVQLPELQYMHLVSMHDVDVGKHLLGICPSIRTLRLVDCNAFLDVSSLAAVESLQSISLSSMQIADVSPLLNLPKLNSLTIDNLPITELNGVSTSRALESLVVRNCGILKCITGLWPQRLQFVNKENPSLKKCGPKHCNHHVWLI